MIQRHDGWFPHHSDHVAAFARLGCLNMVWCLALNWFATHYKLVVVAGRTARGDAGMIHLGANPGGVVCRVGMARRAVIVGWHMRAWRIHLAERGRTLAIVAVQTSWQIQGILVVPFGWLPCRCGVTERTVIGVGREMR